MPRQLVALCLVRGSVHNTCVFLPDQTNVSGCKSVAGDVVLHLEGGIWLAQKLAKQTQLTCCSVIFWGKPLIITVLLGVACLQSSSPGDLRQFAITHWSSNKVLHCSQSIWTCLCSVQDCDLCSSCYPHQLSLSSSGSPSSSCSSPCFLTCFCSSLSLSLCSSPSSFSSHNLSHLGHHAHCSCSLRAGEGRRCHHSKFGWNNI